MAHPVDEEAFVQFVRFVRFGCVVVVDSKLVTFGASDSVTHIGIYVGEHKFVHASSVAGRVIVSPMDRPPSELIRPLKGGRRLLAIGEPPEQRLGGS